MNDNALEIMKLSNWRTYYASFYEGSIIFSFIEKNIEKELRKNLKRLIKENKIKLLARKKFTDEYWKAYEDEYKKKDKQMLLAEHEKNFELRYSDITEVVVKPYRTHTTKTYEEPPIAGHIWFVTGEEKNHFNHEYKKEDEKLEMLRKFFTHRYHFKAM